MAALPLEYEHKSIDELLKVLSVAKKSGSGSIQEFKDLIIKKYHTQNDQYKAFVQQRGGWGFIGDDIADLRRLLMEYNLYEPNKNK